MGMSLNLFVDVPQGNERPAHKMMMPRVSAGLTARANVSVDDVIRFGDYNVLIEEIVHSYEPTDSGIAPASTLRGRLISWSASTPVGMINDLKDMGFKSCE